ASRRLVADLAAAGTFDLHPLPNREAIDDALVGGDIGAALVIAPDFDRELAAAEAGGPPPVVQVIYDGGEAVLAGNAEAYVRSLLAATGAELQRRARRDGGGVAVVSRALFNRRLDGKPFMVAGTFGFVLSFLTTI